MIEINLLPGKESIFKYKLAKLSGFIVVLLWTVVFVLFGLNQKLKVKIVNKLTNIRIIEKKIDNNKNDLSVLNHTDSKNLLEKMKIFKSFENKEKFFDVFNQLSKCSKASIKLHSVKKTSNSISIMGFVSSMQEINAYLTDLSSFFLILS